MSTDDDRPRRTVPTWLVITLISTLLFVLCIGVPVATVLMLVGRGLQYVAQDANQRQTGDAEARRQAEWFMEKLAAEDFDAAYSIMSRDYQSTVDRKRFRSWADQPGLKTYTPSALAGPTNASHHKTATSRRSFVARLHANGSWTEFKFYLLNVDGEWVLATR